MKLRLLLDEEIRGLIRHLSPNVKRKVREALDDIAGNPRAGKFLIEELGGLQSYRVGQLRIVYRVSSSYAEVLGLGARETIYEKVAAELRQKK